MGWFSRKQPRPVDDALVERTLAFAQEVAHEEPEDEQALLAMIDGIKMMPPKPAATIDAVEAPAVIDAQPSPQLPSDLVTPERILPATLPPIELPSMVSPSMTLPSAVLANVADAPIEASASVPETDDAPEIRSAIVPTDRPSAIVTPPVALPSQRVVHQPAVSSSSDRPALRQAAAERVRSPEPRRSSSSAPPQSEMRREIAQRVQNFKAHQQRLNDEREARIKKIYAEMQARLDTSGAPKSPPVS